MPNINLKGLTTIVWGTNCSETNTPAGAIVESMRLTPKNGAPIEIEDNNGFAAVAVMLSDGFDAQLTCLYDANKTWPNVNQNANILLQTIPVGGTMGANVNNFSNYPCFLGADPEIDTARKREATISLKVCFRPGIVLT